MVGRNWLRHLAGGFTVVALGITAASAHAEDEFDVAISEGKVTVKAKGSWHINKAYPWKLTVGEVKISSDKFSLSDSTATVAAPKGEGKLRGGVCSGDQCRMFQKTITIR